MKQFFIAEGLIWLILGIGLSIGSIELGLGSTSEPGAGFVAFIAGVLLGLFGLILMLRHIIKGPDERTLLEWNYKTLRLPSLTLLILFGYTFLLETLGFLYTTSLCLFLLFKLSDPQKWFRPLITASVTTALVYIIFTLWLKVPLPRGIFWF